MFWSRAEGHCDLIFEEIVFLRQCGQCTVGGKDEGGESDSCRPVPVREGRPD